MASGDAAWLHMDRPVNELIVNAVLWFDGPLDHDMLRTALAERIVGRFDRFRQRVEDTGRVAWWVEDPQFDLDAHLSYVHVPAPGDLDQLQQLANRLIAVPLPRDRPLWQISVVDGFEGGTALIARLHHCIADGIALFRVLMSLADEAQAAADTEPAVHVATPRPPVLQRAYRGVLAFGELVGLPPDARTALRGVRSSARRGSRAGSGDRAGRGDRAGDHSADRAAPALGTAKTIVWSEPIPLESLRAAARAVGATINDLVLAALAGALHTHLDTAGGPVRDVRAVLPVNLRPIDPHSLDPARIVLGNRFGLVFLRLPVSAHRAERIRLIQRRTAALKRSAMAVVALGIIEAAGHAPHRFVQLLIGVFSAKGSLVVTNVPGPSTPLHLGGTRLVGAIAWPPPTGSIALGASVISYCGSAVIGVMADDRLVPDARQLLRRTCAELAGFGVDQERSAVG